MIENNTKLLDKVRRDLFDPAFETAVIDPLNALSNGFNFMAEKSGSNLRTGKIAKEKEVQYETPVDGAAASVAGGLAASIPYTVAGQLIGGVTRMATRRFDTFVKLPTAIAGALMSQRTANIVAGGVYDGMKDTREGETHLGNALGGAAAFAVFEHGNAKAQGMKGFSWLTQHMKVGVQGSFAHVLTSDIVSGKNPLERKDYIDVALSGAAMNTALPLVQKGAGHLIDRVNLRLGRGIPIDRDFARQGDPKLQELGKQVPLTRVHIADGQSPRANHKEQAIFVSRNNSLRERAHETQHLISQRQQVFEPLFRKAADVLSHGDEWLSWQLFRQARLHEELGARKAEALVDPDGHNSMSIGKLRNYLPLWREEFKQFKDSGGTYRPELDFSLKQSRSIKERAQATVESDLEAAGLVLGARLKEGGVPEKPRELTLTEARKILGLAKNARHRYDNDYDYDNDNYDYWPYGDYGPEHDYRFDKKFNRDYANLINGKSPGAVWIARQLRRFSPVRESGELTQKHLDEFARQWRLFKEIKPIVNDPKYKDFHISPYHVVDRNCLRNSEDAIAFLDLWTKVAKPRAQFRYNGNPNPNSVAIVAKYYSDLPFATQATLAKLRYGEFHKIDTARIGDKSRLIDCAKAWKVEPDLPKKVAEKIGKMSDKHRYAAKIAWQEMKMEAPEDSTKAEQLEYFWNAFKEWSEKDSAQFFRTVGESPAVGYHVSAGNVIDKILGTFHGKTLSWSERKELRKAFENEWGYSENKPFSMAVDLRAGQYKKALDYLKKDNYEHEWDEGQWSAPAAIRLVNTFGHRWQDWLKLQAEDSITNHDASHWLPMAPTKKLQGLDNWLFKFHDRPQEQLRIVAKNWAELSEVERKLSYKAMLALCASKKYAGQRHSGFATESARWSVNEHSYSSYESRWLGSLDVESPFPLHKVWKEGELTARFLPRDDVRALYAGEHTNCCQHPEGVGSTCAWHGQESPNGGIFVVEDNGKNIIAQSWTWVSDDGGVCFDSIEGKNLYQRDNRPIAELYNQAARDLAERHHKVTAGRNGKLDMDFWQVCKSLEHPSDFSGYANDSVNQVVLAWNGQIPRKTKEQANWIRGARSTDLERAREIAKQIYPENWQFITPGDYGLVLDTKTNGVVGYATLDSAERYISDIAVLPKFTQHSMKLFNALGKYLQRVGGVWTADCRESTSYRYMKLQEKRGRVVIESEGPASLMNGEPMYRISFRVPTREARREAETVGAATE